MGFGRATQVDQVTEKMVDVQLLAGVDQPWAKEATCLKAGNRV
jgi:hypothetical protein